MTRGFAWTTSRRVRRVRSMAASSRRAGAFRLVAQRRLPRGEIAQPSLRRHLLDARVEPAEMRLVGLGEGRPAGLGAGVDEGRGEHGRHGEQPERGAEHALQPRHRRRPARRRRRATPRRWTATCRRRAPERSRVTVAGRVARGPRRGLVVVVRRGAGVSRRGVATSRAGVVCDGVPLRARRRRAARLDVPRRSGRRAPNRRRSVTGRSGGGVAGAYHASSPVVGSAARGALPTSGTAASDATRGEWWAAWVYARAMQTTEPAPTMPAAPAVSARTVRERGIGVPPMRVGVSAGRRRGASGGRSRAAAPRGRGSSARAGCRRRAGGGGWRRRLRPAPAPRRARTSTRSPGRAAPRRAAGREVVHEHRDRGAADQCDGDRVPPYERTPRQAYESHWSPPPCRLAGGTAKVRTTRTR